MVRQKDIPSPRDFERAERLRKVIEALYETNKSIPVIVEGNKDVSALRELGLVGEIITLNRGKNLRLLFGYYRALSKGNYAS